MYIKDFDNWNIVKKNTDTNEYKPPFVKEGQIWWAKIGINIGTEVFGKGKTFNRPVLIFKKFSSIQFLCIPLTSNSKPNLYSYSLFIKGRVSALSTSQIRVISYKRLEGFMFEIEEYEFQKVVRFTISKITPSLFRRGRGYPQ
jgi:mRNA interferase MazF